MQSVVKRWFGLMTNLLCSFLIVGCTASPPVSVPDPANVNRGCDSDAAEVSLMVDPRAGSLIVKYVDSAMSDRDRLILAQLFSNPECGSSTAWENEKTGYHFRVIAVQSWETQIGICYEFILDAELGKNSDLDVFGTACSLSEMLWIVS